MTELFANFTLGAVVVAGLLMIGGVIFVASLNDPRNAMRPGGRMGRLRDELLVVGTIAPFLAMIVMGWAIPALRQASWWFPVLVVVSVACVAASVLAPPVRRARARVEVLRKKAVS